MYRQWQQKLNLWLFGHDITEATRQFLMHLSWSFWGGLIASLVMMGVHITVGRLLGPEQYGRYNLLLAWGQLLMIPLLYGLDVSNTRAVAISKTRQEIQYNVSGSGFFVLLMGLIFLLINLFFHEQIARLLQVSSIFIWLILAYALLMSVRLVLDGSVRGLKRFRFQFAVRITETLVTLAVFIGLFIIGGKNDSYVYYMYVLYAGTLVAIILYLINLRTFIGRADWQVMGSLLSYGNVLVVGTVVGSIFNSVDKILIGRYLSVAQLGLYGAYYTASTNLVAQASAMFINVFFPFASQRPDGYKLRLKLTRIYKLGFFPGVLVLGLVITVIMKLYGDKYPLDWWLVAGFSILGLIQIILTVNTSLIMAIAKKLYWQYVIYINLLSLLFLVGYAVLIASGYFTLRGVLVVIILYVSVAIGIQNVLLNKYDGTITNKKQYSDK